MAALETLSEVVIRPPHSSFLHQYYPNRLVTTRALLLMQIIRRCGGKRLYLIGPLGGALWESRSDWYSPRERRARGLLSPLLSEKRLYLGTSVIPSADNRWIRDAEYAGVRDVASLESLWEAGYTNCQYFPDPAFLAAPEVRGPQEEPIVAVSVRSKIPECHKDEGYSTKIARAVKVVTEVLSSDTQRDVQGFFQVSEDALFNAELSSENGVGFNRSKLTLESAGPFYRRAGIVVSNRLHCLLFGALNGSLPLALTTLSHSKVVGLFRTLGWDDLILDVDNLGDIRDRLGRIVQQRVKLLDVVHTQVLAQQKIAREELRRIFLD